MNEMDNKRVLIVDDERNIRLTLSQTLESLAMESSTAANGEEAIARLEEEKFGLILLDLKMPGMDGMEVLRKVREIHPDIRVIIITAYGTIESAVEAMKLGAVDFIQKPFAPVEIRQLVSQVLDREKLDENKAKDYASHLELAKRCIGNRNFDAAEEHVRAAISLDPARAEAFNLLGALLEIRGDRLNALKNYRAALSLDPTYEAAAKNLDRATDWRHKGAVILGGVAEPKKPKEEKNQRE
jgi:DNA-binding response OmpR family regulator